MCGDVSDIGLEQGNKRLWAKQREDVAKKLWERATIYGVEGGDVNHTIVEAIKSLESRNRVCSKKVGSKRE